MNPQSHTERSLAVRNQVKFLNGAESIGLLEFLVNELRYDIEFVTACEVWLRAAGKCKKEKEGKN